MGPPHDPRINPATPDLLDDQGTRRINFSTVGVYSTRPLLRVYVYLISRANLLIWATSIIGGVSNQSNRATPAPNTTCKPTLTTPLALASLRIDPINNRLQTFSPSYSNVRPGPTGPAEMRSQVRQVANVSGPTVTIFHRPTQTVENSAKQYPPGRVSALVLARTLRGGCGLPAPHVPTCCRCLWAAPLPDRRTGTRARSARCFTSTVQLLMSREARSRSLKGKDGARAQQPLKKKKAHGAVTWSGRPEH